MLHKIDNCFKIAVGRLIQFTRRRSFRSFRCRTVIYQHIDTDAQIKVLRFALLDKVLRHLVFQIELKSVFRREILSAQIPDRFFRLFIDAFLSPYPHGIRAHRIHD